MSAGKIFRFVLTVALAVSTFLAANHGVSPAAESDEKPNVVFFLVDDLGFMDIGAYNPKTFYETPNVNALAERGMRFTNGYAANPVCSPTRYSIMTGKYPSRVDATNFFSGMRSGRFLPARLHDRMPLSETTLAEAFRAGGYQTYFAGKWHLGPTKDFWPQAQGFDINIGGMNRGAPPGGKRYFSPYGNPSLEDGPPGEHLTARLANETSQFVRQAATKNQPFLAYLSFYTVHTPLMAPKALVDKYTEKANRLGLDIKSDAVFGPEEQIWPAKHPVKNPARNSGGRGNTSTQPRPRRVRNVQSLPVYAAMIESMDAAVGQVVDALRESGEWDNTIVCFMSDNGGLSTSEGSPTSNLPLRGGKGWLYEGGIREPYLISGPGIDAGQTCDVPVISTDFYPTLLDLAGLPPRDEQTLDGVSLRPLLTGASKELTRESLFWHYPHYSNQGGFPGGAIRNGLWKLVERYEDGRVHLYHLGNDIGERTDLAEQNPDRVDRMRAELHSWYRRVDAKFLMPRPDGPMPWRPAD